MRSTLLLLSKVRLALPVRVSERVASSDLEEEDEVAGTCYMVPVTNPGLVHPEPELLGRGLGTSPNSFSCFSQVANTINCGGGSFHWVWRHVYLHWRVRWLRVHSGG